MSSEVASDFVAGLRSTWSGLLRDAMKSRQATRVVAVRAALGALDNAGAVKLEGEPSNLEVREFGVAENEVPRRVVDREEITHLLGALVEDRVSAAEEYDRLDRSDESARLRPKPTSSVG